MPRQNVHGTGHLKGPAEHQHTGHGHHGRVSKARKGILSFYQAREDTGQKCSASHHVMPPAPPDEHPHGRNQDADDQQLVLCHPLISRLLPEASSRRFAAGAEPSFSCPKKTVV